ncbi:MAG: nucleotidyl transferase AbiEii/AbiGii toxin family protein [Thermodesulfobacteriota bacterium]
MKKPTTADGYTPDMLEVVRSTCLTIATVLGDLMEEIVIVGGLVPSLLLDADVAPDDPYGPHVGTADVDVALSVTLLNEERYKEVSEKLRRAGFEPDEKESGRKTRHRWKMSRGGKVGTVEFLMEPVEPDQTGGKIQSLEGDFGAVTMRGMHLAFQDVERVTFKGTTLKGDTAERSVKVCGPGAFVILKALAIQGRSEPKDAYDIFMVLRNYKDGAASVAARLVPLHDDEDVNHGLEILESNFGKATDTGPSRMARFLRREDDQDLREDVVSYVRRFLSEVKRGAPGSSSTSSGPRS